MDPDAIPAIIEALSVLVAAIGAAIAAAFAAWATIVSLRNEVRSKRMEQQLNGATAKLETLAFKEGEETGRHEERTAQGVRDAAKGSG